MTPCGTKNSYRSDGIPAGTSFNPEGRVRSPETLLKYLLNYTLSQTRRPKYKPQTLNDTCEQFNYVQVCALRDVQYKVWTFRRNILPTRGPQNVIQYIYNHITALWDVQYRVWTFRMNLRPM